ncbi:MAG: 16S rRNA (uracil(1498)-N(3))-methyltransferase [Candidatus Lindowbacteria bacterium]|nr:16S rRNA (uracil(1498)-N(3))-methyltransferase [Candidatus Lindowbacteria bacterium]
MQSRPNDSMTPKLRGSQKLYSGHSIDGPFELDRDNSQKISKVLRLRQGDEIWVVDNSNNAVLCIIENDSNKNSIGLTPQAERVGLLSNFPVCTAISVIKGKRMDTAIEKACEAGVKWIFPFSSDRSVPVKPGDGKQQRWNSIAQAAALQAGFGKPAEILEQANSLNDVLSLSYSFVFFDTEAGKSVQDSTSWPDNELLAQKPLCVIIGPEGGWSYQERKTLKSSVSCISLGNQVFRTESASLLGSYFATQFTQNY